MNNDIINIKTIIEEGFGFEEYFVLYCLYYKNKDLLLDYAKNCKKINTEIFNLLQEKGYISVVNTEKILFSSLFLTEKGIDKIRSLLEKDKQALVSESDFEKFREFYPKKVKKGLSYRPLHSDLKRCKQLYDKLLLETTHEILCKCAKAYHDNAIRSNSEEFMQNLSTWLHQKNYTIHLEEITNNNTNTTSNYTNFDTI